MVRAAIRAPPFASPRRLIFCGVGAAVAAVLAGYFGWVAVSLLTPVEGDEFVSTRDRILVEAIVIFIVACLAYAAFSLGRYVRGRDVRWWRVASTYVVSILATPVAWAALLANFSGG